jgi:PPOX class probable F420-dependent enzyme
MRAPTATLTDEQREYLRAPRYATLATVDPDGAPREAVAWYDIRPDDRILVNSRWGRRWPANLKRDPRLAIAVMDFADGDRWLGLKAHVEQIVDDVERARDDIVALAHRYAGEGGPDAESIATFRTQPRVTFLLRIDDVHDHLEDG